MDIKDMANALGSQVHLRDTFRMLDGMYTLSGIVIRRSKNGLFYQAELTRGNCVCIVNPAEIEIDNGGAGGGQG